MTEVSTRRLPLGEEFGGCEDKAIDRIQRSEPESTGCCAQMSIVLKENSLKDERAETQMQGVLGRIQP